MLPHFFDDEPFMWNANNRFGCTQLNVKELRPRKYKNENAHWDVPSLKFFKFTQEVIITWHYILLLMNFKGKNGPEIVSIWVLFSWKSCVCIEEPKALPIYTQRSSLKLGEEEHITLRKFLRHIQHKINEEVVCKNVLET